MISLTRFLPAAPWIASLILFAGFQPAHGAPLIDEPFDTVGALPAGWDYSNSTGTPTIEITDYQPGDPRLLQERATGGSAGSVIYNEDVVLGDFEGTVVFNIGGASSSRYRGVVLRAQTTGLNEKTYFVVFNQANLMITLDPSSSSNIGTVLATTALKDNTVLAENTDYLLRFTANGNELAAFIYARGDDPTQYDNLLGDVYYTIGTQQGDPAYLSGKFGFRTHYDSAGKTYWSDLKISTIPEPASLTLLGLPLLLIAMRFGTMATR